MTKIEPANRQRSASITGMDAASPGELTIAEQLDRMRIVCLADGNGIETSRRDLEQKIIEAELTGEQCLPGPLDLAELALDV